MGEASGYIWLRHRISDLFSSTTKTLLRWLFADAGICRWNALSSWIRTSCSDQLAELVIPCNHPASIQRASLKEQISRHCYKCRAVNVRLCNVSPARWWHSRWVCAMLGEIPRWRCAQRDWLLSLREFQSCLSALTDSFLFRERLHPSRPLVFFLPGTCAEKTTGQRIRAASDRRAHAGSMPACLAITTERAFACPLHPTRSASLWGCERHDLVRCEWQRIGWQPFSGGFRRGRVIGLCDWPRPLAVICFMQRQT